MADPQFYKEAGKAVGGARTRLDELGRALEEAYARWQELESIREGGPYAGGTGRPENTQ